MTALSPVIGTPPPPSMLQEIVEVDPDKLPLTNGVPFKVTDPVELTVKVQVPDTSDVALTALATKVAVLNDCANALVVANDAVVAFTALATKVAVLNDCANALVVANDAVVAFTALATKVAVLNVTVLTAYPLT